MVMFGVLAFPVSIYLCDHFSSLSIYPIISSGRLLLSVCCLEISPSDGASMEKISATCSKSGRCDKNASVHTS